MVHRLRRARSIFLGAILAAVCAWPALAGDFHVRDFGAKGDGAADDGPAIARAIDAAVKAARPDSPSVVHFDKATYRARSTGNPDHLHLMECVGARNLTIAGHGATIVPALSVRVLNFTDCENVAASDLTIDYDPLPFVQGDIVKVSPESRSFDIQLQDGFPMPAAESIEKRNRAGWPFGCFWNSQRSHFSIERVEPLGDGMLRVHGSKQAAFPGNLDSLTIGMSGFYLPHPDGGNAGNFTIRIERNKQVQLSNVNVWSAPQLATIVARNEGPITFRRVRVEPKPGTARTMCAWRDAFHCKDNRGPLVWEDCAVRGLFDDTFNVSTMLMPMTKAVSDTEFDIVKLGAAMGESPDVRVGDRLVAVDTQAGKEVGRSTVAAATPLKEKFEGRPETRVSLATPIRGMTGKIKFWNENLCNPGSAIRRCVIQGSMRFRSNMTIEDSDITGFIFGDGGGDKEGPVTHDVTWRHNTFHRWLFPRLVSYHVEHSDKSVVTGRLIRNLSFIGNTFADQVIAIDGGDHVRFEDNNFLLPDETLKVLELSNSSVETRSTKVNGAPDADPMKRITVGKNMGPTDIVAER